jgi:hypothetical protein
MKAKIQLLNDLLIAELGDGRRLEHVDAIELAEMLWAHDVTSAEVTAVDWHTDPVGAPLSGQKIAIHSLLRSREESATLRPPPKQSNELTEEQLAKLIATVQENDQLLRELNEEPPQKKN